MKIGAIAGRARACANCTDAMLFNYWERQPETVLIPCTSMPCNARLWLHWCVKTRRCLASYVSCLTFTFLVFDEKYRNLRQFLARGVLVLIFLRNKVSLQTIDVSKTCVWSSLLPLSMEIRMKHTSKSLISFIRLKIEVNIYIFVRHELSRDFAALYVISLELLVIHYNVGETEW